ncbi:EAL domain-containing protein [Massilia sp. Leaf139]|uniref:bifunctional diguanylate cyclase/phosphodiesterase n=1 Tax=Massilia sp. Leaf139 TaxID=1736272 RepID=UPI0006F35716|nr:EAL domain-containing protein [Massilia sp. Leaf139]KQQ97362.1 hypothetical protein ASF77_05280 [Massilia sp. Leaf139]
MHFQTSTTRPHTVGTFLNVLVMACLLPGIAASAIFLLVEYRQERGRVQQQAIELARTVGEAVDTHLLRTQALARAVARAQALTNDDATGFAHRTAQAFSATGLGSSLSLFQLDGGKVVDILQGKERLAPTATSVQAAGQVFRTGLPVISSLHGDPAAGGAMVSTHVPVATQGKVLYSLAIGISSNQLGGVLASHHLDEGWLASLVDPEGRIAARTRNTGLVGRPATDSLRHAIARSPAGMMETVSLDGVANFTAFWRSPKTGFTTVVGVPRATVFGALQWRLAGLAAAVALLFGFGLLLARSMSARIARSFRVLIAPAMALGEGKPLAVPAVRLRESAEVGAAIERAALLLGQRDADLRAQQEELAQFKFFSEHANQMLLLFDEDARFHYANRMACTRLGYTRDEMLGMTLPQIDLAAEVGKLQAVFELCRSAPPPPFERTYTCKDGSSFPVEIGATVLQHRGRWLMYVMPREITERREAEQAIHWAASHDALTGVANRGAALDFVEAAVGRAHNGAAGGALLYVDLDRFKPVNDQHGHEAGDAVLREVARRLQSCVQEGQLLARFGGDEFVLVVADAADPGGHAAQAAHRLIDVLQPPIRVGKLEVNLSACIGISYYPEHGKDAGALLHAADLAMLRAKRQGSGNVVVYSPALDEQARFVLAVERRLQNALDHHGLALHYQPIVDLRSGATIGLEALVRLEDGQEPALGPAAFIPVAEACGLIAPLGDWVAGEACRQQVQWQSEGLQLTVAVNVSPLQFRRPRFAAQIRELIDASGIDPRSLVIELTETAVMENLGEAVAVLHELKALGVRIALDDFGTGYSSLSSLSTLPIDKLKIDQSFVRAIDSGDASRAVIDAVIALGKSLSLELVAEGIETQQAWDFLRERGCHQGQGYFFSRPLAPDALRLWYAQRAGAAAQA